MGLFMIAIDQPPAPPLTAEQVRAQHDALGALLCLLPELGLTAAQRADLGGCLFLEGPELVLSVACALEAAPDLPPEEAPLSGELRPRLRRSLALRSLERLLLTAARRAGDLALCDEADAVREASAVVRRARDAERADAPGARRRLDRLRRALAILDRRAARCARGRRAQAARARAEPGHAPP